LALQFLAAHAVARRAEQIDRVEPANQRRAGILKDGASGRVHMVTTGGADIGAATGELVVRAVLTAGRTLKAGAAEANLHDVFKAGVLGREALKELTN